MSFSIYINDNIFAEIYNTNTLIISAKYWTNDFNILQSELLVDIESIRNLIGVHEFNSLTRIHIRNCMVNFSFVNEVVNNIEEIYIDGGYILSFNNFRYFPNVKILNLTKSCIEKIINDDTFNHLENIEVFVTDLSYIICQYPNVSKFLHIMTNSLNNLELIFSKNKYENIIIEYCGYKDNMVCWCNIKTAVNVDKLQVFNYHLNVFDGQYIKKVEISPLRIAVLNNFRTADFDQINTYFEVLFYTYMNKTPQYSREFFIEKFKPGYLKLITNLKTFKRNKGKKYMHIYFEYKSDNKGESIKNFYCFNPKE